MTTQLEPPEGCQEIEGFILVIEEGFKWFTQYGDITTNFNERGVWGTKSDADDARELFCTQRRDNQPRAVSVVCVDCFVE